MYSRPVNSERELHLDQRQSRFHSVIQSNEKSSNQTAPPPLSNVAIANVAAIAITLRPLKAILF